MSDATLIPSRVANPTLTDAGPNLGGNVMGITCGASGTVRARCVNNKAGTYADYSVSAGQTLVGRFDQVFVTGTSLSSIQLTVLYAQ